MREEAEDSQSVINRDQHHALPGECFPVGGRRRTGAAGISARMEPYHHRMFFVRGYSSPDIKVEAILTYRRRLRRSFGGTLCWALAASSAPGASLHAHGPEFIG